MMRTEEVRVTFKTSDVSEFIKVMDERNPIYESVEKAQSYGFTSIPLPPTMPLIVYKQLDIPWTLTEPVIHRNQECKYHHQMYINQTYTASIRLDEQIDRKSYCIIKHSLLLFDDQQNLCFEGIYQIVCGGVVI
ncbi:FAS1-like dehydratase domain-containing protein [Bacillus marasmi]|uniref:FAS1-like dehydratase domain-containing protein n=1 Tax=Bacillus marasmi TaxID=1926279 RepID=UPI0011C9DE41|nr:MaoC family dehydratase N-terminal domain-containing protein [Bacillus marasmi]